MTLEKDLKNSTKVHKKLLLEKKNINQIFLNHYIFQVVEKKLIKYKFK
jgi:hypothetical protein|tara:strand:- start:305 stop:448 length:144 start_codon:yes stop_codon:yes gene_type:complete